MQQKKLAIAFSSPILESMLQRTKPGLEPAAQTPYTPTFDWSTLK
jgi:hypothetical protein